MPKRRVTGPEASALIQRAALKVEEVKAALREEIQRAGITERELSRRLGFGPTYLTNLFMASDGRVPVGLRLETLLAMLEVLEVDFGEFMARISARISSQPVSGPRSKGREPAAPAPRDDIDLVRTLSRNAGKMDPATLRAVTDAALEFLKKAAAAATGPSASAPRPSSRRRG